MRRSRLLPVSRVLALTLGLASCAGDPLQDPGGPEPGDGGAPGTEATGGPEPGQGGAPGTGVAGGGAPGTGTGTGPAPGAATGGGGAPGAGTGSGGAPGAGTGSGGSEPGQGGSPEQPAAPGDILNGIQWADTAGNPIQAHGGGMIKVGPYYYWFGENRNPNGTFYAVSSYRSTDLRTWEFRNHVLTMDSDPDLNPANIERPKVVYNESTGRYVMWMHWENGRHYGEARAAVASSSTVDGDYTYHGSFRPLAGTGVVDHDKPGYMSRDCGLFVDTDNKAYFISASNENYDLNLYELTPDYLSIARLAAVLFKGGHREAPALFKRNGVYFLLTSGATGWSPNQAKYATSTALDRGWSEMTNIGDGTTFHSQSTYVLPVQGSAGTAYLYMGDRWAGAWGEPVNRSTYVWQPLSFPSDRTMSMSWNNTLTIDAAAGTITGATHAFKLVNRKSGKVMEVMNGATDDGASVVQYADNGGDNQRWRLNYNGAGYFRLTNVGSGKVLDVPDHATDDGIALKQWTNNDGDNQAWLFIDLGGGHVQIRNKESGKLVTVRAGSTEDAAVIEQRAGDGGEAQAWRLVAAD
ncbi:Ricin B lectin [Sorangium cellulosum]|uniref:Ricin B lectin n=1 Tax=Sorangium cellulosum TaxID=56 RepID=A0A4P2PV14_SORCE|nr:RICIN domain-containing protein [Sorangium cellulosum]AUX20351.1 Ricin B lectin [Sorangium cellulosum]